MVALPGRSSHARKPATSNALAEGTGKEEERRARHEGHYTPRGGSVKEDRAAHRSELCATQCGLLPTRSVTSVRVESKNADTIDDGDASLAAPPFLSSAGRSRISRPPSLSSAIVPSRPSARSR